MMFKELPKSSGPKNLIKMKDGERLTGVFRGNVVTLYQHWNGTFSEPCTRATGCARCEKGEKGSFKFRVNFVVSENGVLVAKVFQGGKRLFDSLLAINKEFGDDFPNHRMTITRTGSKKEDTTYSVMPVLKGGALTGDALKAVEAVELNALGSEAADEGEDDAA